MGKDNEIPAIFNPKRVRAPSVVITGDSPGSGGGGSFILNHNQTGIQHSDSVTSHQQSVNPLPVQQPQANTSRLKRWSQSCCSELAKKMYFGFCVTILVTISWVGATHAIKFLYLSANSIFLIPNRSGQLSKYPFEIIINKKQNIQMEKNATSFILTKDSGASPQGEPLFNAPFFASWFCTNFSILFFPIYLLGRIALKKCEGPGEVLGEVFRGFRERGFTVGRYINRCMSFALLWLLMTYLYILSLKALLATDVMALFATNICCVYLLSWVILHEQFVGIRIVAVILCDTGIALLAYMDGITGTPTLGGVVLAALAAAGYAVFKVMFKKLMADPPIHQIAFTFSFLGFLNASLLWPICIALYLSGIEVMPWDIVSWIILLIASVLLLVFHLMTQFGGAVTYQIFVILGLITAVPASAGIDVVLYNAKFAGMKLAGIILIAVGFFLVLFPNNWPSFITKVIRKTGLAILRIQCCWKFREIDYDNSKYHLVGTQREMGSSKRNSWDHNSFSSTLSLHRKSEMTDFQNLQQFIQLHQLSPNHIPNITLQSPIIVNETNFSRKGSKRKFSYGSIE